MPDVPAEVKVGAPSARTSRRWSTPDGRDAGRVPVERLRHAVPSYPTMSEVWLRVLELSGQ